MVTRMARTTTVYEYFNESLAVHYQKSLIYIDDMTGCVLFHSQAHVTEWHGSAIHDRTRGMLTLKFDAYNNSPRRANGQSELKTTVLFQNAVGEFSGHDYRGRGITLKPKAKYRFTTRTNAQGQVQVHDGGAWVCTHMWSEVGWGWLDVELDQLWSDDDESWEDEHGQPVR